MVTKAIDVIWMSYRGPHMLTGSLPEEVIRSLLKAAFEIQLLSTPSIKCGGNFRIFQFASAIADNSAETFVYYVGNGFSMPQNFAKEYDLFF